MSREIRAELRSEFAVQMNLNNAWNIMSKLTQRKLTECLAREKAANRAKDEFLAALYHELRTPLNPVLLLASDYARDDELPPQVRMDFNTICKNIELEARLIDDLLDLTRIERGKVALNLAKVDVHAVLQDAVSIVEKEVEEKHIFLKAVYQAVQHEVLGDPVRLQQIFWNILKNAVKFTANSGQIYVETRTVPGNKLLVKIVDNGIGMSAEEIRRAFGKFSQGSHSQGGLGLGLAISRELVKLHFGTIHATSLGKGKGAEFSIVFPTFQTQKKSARSGVINARRVDNAGNGHHVVVQRAMKPAPCR